MKQWACVTVKDKYIWRFKINSIQGGNEREESEVILNPYSPKKLLSPKKYPCCLHQIIVLSLKEGYTQLSEVAFFFKLTECHGLSQQHLEEKSTVKHYIAVICFVLCVCVMWV